jgi:FG-GAP-like repeat/IPT/TIG domain
MKKLPWQKWMNRRASQSRTGLARQAKRRSRLHVEALEERTVLSFSAPVFYSVGATPVGVMAADFNHDGKVDLAVADSGSLSVSVLLGNGGGAYGTAANYRVGVSPRSVAVGDFNGDGNEDLVVANSSNATLSLLLGNGDGTFAPAQNVLTEYGPVAVTAGDFNGDGKWDLAVAIEMSSAVDMLFGNGDGTFQAPVSYRVGSSPESVAVGDFTGDGKLDLAVANYGSNSVSVLLNNGDGTFQPALNYPCGGGPVAVTVGDLNGDGKLDVAVANRDGNSVSTFLNQGNGAFAPAGVYATDLQPVSIAVGDFDRNGKLEIVIANSGSNDLSLLPANGDGTFAAAVNLAAGAKPDGLTVADVNGDGAPDLVVSDFNSDSVAVLVDQPPNPQPTTTGLSVTSAVEGSGDVTVTVNGAGFLPSSTVLWNGSTLATTYVNATQLQATVPAADLTDEGTSAIAVANPAPGGGMSNAQTFTITDAPLAIRTTGSLTGGVGTAVSGVLATFTDANLQAPISDFTATVTWGDGSTSTGTIAADPQGGFDVTGSHTYLTAGAYHFTVQIQDVGGAAITAAGGATISGGAQPIQDGETEGPGFWESRRGQQLLQSFNGGPTATALGNWLATAFPDLYGANAGANDLAGLTNTQIAGFFRKLRRARHRELDARVLATAFDIYATTSSLGGNAAAAFGFRITADGLGARTYDVRCTGAAFGVANETTLTVSQIMQAVDQQASGGVLYAANPRLVWLARRAFHGIDRAGDPD